jgi:hypothetical protein
MGKWIIYCNLCKLISKDTHPLSSKCGPGMTLIIMKTGRLPSEFNLEIFQIRYVSVRQRPSQFGGRKN